MTNEEMSAKEVADFIANTPVEYGAYVRYPWGEYKPNTRQVCKGEIVTWMGDKLGDCNFGKCYTDNFGGTRAHVWMTGINGAEYYGTWHNSAEDYCRLKMTAASRRKFGK